MGLIPILFRYGLSIFSLTDLVHVNYNNNNNGIKEGYCTLFAI